LNLPILLLPQKKRERKISEDITEVTVFSEEKYGYKNVLAGTKVEEKIPLDKKDLVTVTWKNEEEEVGFDVFDNNGNGLIDYVEWNVPHLSEQDFEISLNVLNVQSYPVVGGNWTVKFETLGKADLVINVTNGTTWTTDAGPTDLQFLKLTCGTEEVKALWNNGLFVKDYECNETSFETSRVLTTGGHYLEFTFGSETAYAANDATDPYDNLSQIYANDFSQEFPLTTVTVVNVNTETIIDEGYTHTASATRIYTNVTDEYKISYGCTYDNFGVGDRAIIETWIRKNGATDIVPSRTGCYTRTSGTDADRCSNQGVLVADLSNGDYVELMSEQIKQRSTGNMKLYGDCYLYLQRVRRPVSQQYDSTGGSTYALGSDTTVNLDVSTHNDARAFISGTGNDEIEIDADSWYKIYYHTCADNGPQGNRHNGRLFIRSDTTKIIPSDAYSYYRDNSIGDINCEQGFLLYNFSDGDNINMRKTKVVAENAAGSTFLVNQSWMLIEQVPFTDVFMAYVDSGSQSVPLSSWTNINFTREYYSGESYLYTEGNSRIPINSSRLYEVAYVFGWDDGAPGSDRNIVCGEIRVNGTADGPFRHCDYSRGDVNGARYGSFAANAILNLTQGDYLELSVIPVGRAVNVLNDATWISIVPLNTWIDATPPVWIDVTSNNSLPDPNDIVELGAYWNDTSGLDAWEFYWNLGSGFEPAGSGTFSGTLNWSNITKTIPSSMEGSDLYYYFRASDLDGFENQTDGTHFVSVQDVTPPTVNSQSINDSEFYYGGAVRIDTNVTDNTAVDSVWVSIRPASVIPKTNGGLFILVCCRINNNMGDINCYTFFVFEGMCFVKEGCIIRNITFQCRRPCSVNSPVIRSNS